MTYTDMKESGIFWIGKIPSHWSCVDTKYLFEIRKDIAGELGHTVLSITQKGIKPKDMTDKGQFALDYAKYQLVNPGDFAMNHMDLLTGWVDISRYSGVTSPDYRVFKSRKPDAICPDFFKYVFQVGYMHRIFYGLGQGVAGFGRWRLPADMFLNYPLPVPPLAEQSLIASALDRICDGINSIIQEAESSIGDYKHWKSSVIYQAVTKGLNPDAEMKDSGVPWIGMIPCSWKRMKVTHLFSVIGSGTTPASIDSSYYNGTIPWLQSGDIKGDCITDTSKKITQSAIDYFSTLKIYKAPFIAVAMYGASIANTGIVSIDACTNQACCVLSEVRGIIDFRYVYYAICASKEELLLSARGGTQPNISQEIIKQLRIPVPGINEQIQISKYLDKKVAVIESVIKEKETLIAELESYKKSLIYEAVTGKRKVV